MPMASQGRQGLGIEKAKGLKVLCVHGWMDNAGSFDALIPALAEQLLTCARGGNEKESEGETANEQKGNNPESCKLPIRPQELVVVCVDLPGHGKSYHKAEDHPVLNLQACFDMRRILQALRWDNPDIPVTLMGHSMGGALSQMFAGCFPELVHKVVSLDAPGPYFKSVKMSEHLKEYYNKLEAMSKKKAPVYPSKSDMVKRLQEGTNKHPEMCAKMLLARGSRPATIKDGGAGGYVFSHDPRIRAPSLVYYSLDQIEDCLGHISCPVLSLKALENLFPEDYWKQCRALMAKQSPAVESHEIPGGHYFHLHEPEKVKNIVADFICKSF
eukprot:Nk52_evm75s745 gene=Nk52_evmTU75s745